MSYDEQPDDPHGECRLEIERLQADAKRYRDAVVALAGRLGFEGVVTACEDYVACEDLLDDSFDGEDYSLPRAVEVLMGIKADHDAALEALDGLEDTPEPVFAACRDYAGALNAMGDYFDDDNGSKTVPMSFPQRIAVLVGKVRDYDRMLAEGAVFERCEQNKESAGIHRSRSDGPTPARTRGQSSASAGVSGQEADSRGAAPTRELDPGRSESFPGAPAGRRGSFADQDLLDRAQSFHDPVYPEDGPDDPDEWLHADRPESYAHDERGEP